MNNVDLSVIGDKLTLTVNLSKDLGLSKSGKNTIVASTQGNVEIEGRPGFFIGLNVYRKKPEK